MSNFNEYFRSVGAKRIVDKFFSNVDRYNQENKIKDLDFEIVEDNKPASYYIENEETASFVVKVYYSTAKNPDQQDVTEFEIPREIDGAFIIEGSYRIAINQLDGDFDCRISMSGSGNRTVHFDFNREYDITNGVLKVAKPGENGELVQGQKPIEIKLDNIDSVDPETKELLKLTDTQIKKLQIKLDLDYKPEYITKRLIEDCIAFGDDREKDLIVDKKINSVAVSFFNYLLGVGKTFKANFYGTANQIQNYYQKFNKLPNPVSTITNLAFKFFKGSTDISSKDTKLQISPGINAINLESIGNKVTIRDSVAMNPTFTDLIDVADTPINQNVNKQNSLTVSTHITDDGIMFDVYDINFMKVTIPYLDYLNKKVCTSEYVDYNTKQIKPNKDGQVKVKYRMKRKFVPVSEVELIDLHPDYRLSETSRRIPFLNYTDSVRISMGTGMLKQAIPLVNAQRPLVDTGNCEELNDNVLNEKFNYDKGKVKDITQSSVLIELPNKEIVEVPRRTAIQSINDVSVYTEPKVKKGQVVKKGDIITGAVGLTNNTYKSGVNALVLYHAYFGLVNEDALVISESFANRIASYSIIDVSFKVKNTNALKWIAPVGTKVKSGDNIVNYLRAQRLDEINKSLNESLGGLTGEDKGISEYVFEECFRVDNNIDEATVADVLIQKNSDPIIDKGRKIDYTFANTSDEVIDEYMKDFDKKRKVIYDNFPEYIASDRLKPIVMDRKDYKVVYNVRIRLIKKTIGMVGSKITNPYGGKGVVSCVKPDELMPIMVDKSGKKTRVEVVMNPYSTINRKISSVLLNLSLGNIAHRISDLVDEYKNDENKKSKIMPLVQKYYPGRYDNMDVDEFIKLHNSKPIEEVYYFNVGSYSSITQEDIEKWEEELGVESQSTILMPESELTDLDELKENLSPEEYKAVLKGMEGKFKPVDKKLQCGYINLLELYHIPSYSNKVSSSMFDVDISPKKMSPAMRRGAYHLQGQQIGEMELWALLSRNAKSFITESRKSTASKENQIFLNNLLGLGLTITDNKGYNQGGSDMKNRIDKMKHKFRNKFNNKF